MKSRAKKYLALAVFYLLLLGAWQLVFVSGAVPHYVLPSPRMVAVRLGELVADGLLGPSVAATLGRMLAGFALSAAIGLALGVVMGMNATVRDLLRSLLLGIQTLPSVAWVPIALLIFGLRDTGILFVIVMSSASAMAIATVDGIAHIPPLYLRAARALGTPPHAMWRRVILPAAFPRIVTGIKLGWTLGWHGAVSAELIKSSIGLGFLLHMGRELSDAAQVIGMMLVMIAVGLVIDRCVFEAVERRVRRAWGLIPAPAVSGAPRTEADSAPPPAD